MTSKIFTNLALQEATSCPQCHNTFTYRHREAGLEALHRPLVLCCGHKVCLECLQKSLSANSPIPEVEEQVITPLNCHVCGQLQPRPAGLREKDIFRTFPLDTYTVGLLTVLENFGAACLPQFATVVEPIPLAFRPTVAVTLVNQARAREMDALERTTFCHFCAGSAVDWKCSACDATICFHCTDQHDVQCLAKDTALIPFSLTGELIRIVPKVPETPDHVCSWDCMIIDGHGHSRSQCKPAGTPSNPKSVTLVEEDLSEMHPYIENLIASTVESIAELTNAKQDITALFELDRACLTGFFGRLATACTFSCNMLLRKQTEVDGKRLAILRSLSSSFAQQMRHITFMQHRWNSIVMNYARFAIDLQREQAAFERELQACVLWNPPELLTKRVKMDRFTEAVWEKGIPKGMRRCIEKSRLDLSLPDAELGHSQDAAPVSAFLVKPDGPRGDLRRYQFAQPCSALPCPVPSRTDRDAANLLERFRELYNVDGMVPRSWFPEFWGLIDQRAGLCVVTHVENPPATFWIRICKSREEDFRKLIAWMQEYCVDAPRVDSEITSGQIYAAKIAPYKLNAWNCGRTYNQQYNSGLWMRVQVISQEAPRPSGEVYSCRFIDIGCVQLLTRVDLRVIPRRLQLLTPCSRPAQLSGFTPYYNGQVGCWSPRACDHIYKWLAVSGIPFMIVEDVIDERILVVDVWVPSGVRSLKEFLMWVNDGHLAHMSAAFERARDVRRALLKS
ncbi:hypothetical protein BV898_04759 [Hypsibius exemplaris]|uniref:B box-type domain-containing protein n=1 Tax=Hypsibius exemplaris TaxID=2072580 RepID=A0A1W0X1E3_HYPEX|nr:hypothetical protein BV898_04759 [Hypsibius exemplaris]